jgi:hypothetical protein
LSERGGLSEIERSLAVAASAHAGSEAPWLSPYRHAARDVLACASAGAALAERLNGALAKRLPIALDAGRLRFVPHSALPDGEPYEAFIARTACVPTRDKVHDLFNGLVWLTFPDLKCHLNRLQSRQIEACGVGQTRGAVRDALTLFDENAALWQAPAVLADALLRRDWAGLFITHRMAWHDARPVLFGHALLEKLMQPRKPITAHVWLLPTEPDAGDGWHRHLTPQRLAARSWLPLPVLGVPGWWPANEASSFYDDANVFRPAVGARSSLPAHRT